MEDSARALRTVFPACESDLSNLDPAPLNVTRGRVVSHSLLGNWATSSKPWQRFLLLERRRQPTIAGDIE